MKMVKSILGNILYMLVLLPVMLIFSFVDLMSDKKYLH